MNRREFLIKSGALTAGCLAGGAIARAATSPAAHSRHPGQVAIICDPSDKTIDTPSARWAIGTLRDALTDRNIDASVCARIDEAPDGAFCIVATDGVSPFARDLGVAPAGQPEVFSLLSGRLGTHDVLVASGTDSRSLVYALTELADSVGLAADPIAALHLPLPVTERPANEVRGIVRAFASAQYDLAWYWDKAFWENYLSMLATHRFNRIQLAFGLGCDASENVSDSYLQFPYPFLVRVPDRSVEMINLSVDQRERNLEMLRFASDEAARRGLDFHLGLWTHSCAGMDSLGASHRIAGLTPANHAPYCGDALALVLKECPNIRGVTLRTGPKSGIPEGSRDFWATVLEGCKRAGRPLSIDLDPEGLDSLTLKAAQGTGMPVSISPKFWAEHLGLPYHQAAVRPQDLPARDRGTGLPARREGGPGSLTYSYGELFSEDRKYSVIHRIWPGTQRVLLWGDPLFAAAYSRAFCFCGGKGAEIFEPLSFKGRMGSGKNGGRGGYADASLRPPGGDFKKYDYTYRLWGRLLYNPDAQPDVWERQLNRDHGAAADEAGRALAQASRILPLVTTVHAPSVCASSYWPEMYANVPLVGASQEAYLDAPGPMRFGAVSPLDPQLFARVDDCAAALLQGRADSRYSPIEVAQRLEDLCQGALEGLAKVESATADRADPAYRRLVIDASVQAGLGWFFARKLRAAVLLAVYERTGAPEALSSSVASYRDARLAWARAAATAGRSYDEDMAFGQRWFQRGHWSDRLAAIDRDIAALTRAQPSPQAAALPPARLAALVRDALGSPRRSDAGVQHTPPSSFVRGKPVDLIVMQAIDQPAPRSGRLLYRHANQTEDWQAAEMRFEGAGCRALIPGVYTNSPYPLQYYFELKDGNDLPWLHPGLGPDLCRQPYFVVREA